MRLLILFAFILLIPLVYGVNYGNERYGIGSYGVGGTPALAGVGISTGSAFAGSTSRGGGGIGTISPIKTTSVTVQAGTSLRIFLVSKHILGSASFPFTLKDNSHHSIVVDNVDVQNQKATITISSRPVTVTFNVNDVKKFDLNENGFYDTEVVLESLHKDAKGGVFHISALDDNERVAKQSVNHSQAKTASSDKSAPKLTAQSDQSTPKITGKNIVQTGEIKELTKTELVKQYFSAVAGKITSKINSIAEEFNKPQEKSILTGYSIRKISNKSLTDALKESALMLGALFLFVALLIAGFKLKNRPKRRTDVINRILKY